MFKYIKLAALALLFSVSFTACDDDDNPANNNGNHFPTYSTDEAYALCQGNMYGGIGGSIDKMLIGGAGQASVIKDFFNIANSQQLGDNPQEGIRYGSHIYVSVQGSNVLWVLDAATLKIQHQISMSQPTALCATEGYVFATNFDGNVSRVDTLDFAVPAKTVAVGPNPDGITACQNKVYVTVSDGFNGENGFANGKKVVELDANELTKTQEYGVGLNPYQIVTNQAGELFVVCRGNYADVTPMVQKITREGQAVDYEAGSLIAMDGNMLYVVDSQTDWNTGSTQVTIKRINTIDNTKEEKFIAADDMPAAPTHIAVHPVTRDFYICSDKSAFGYSENGWVYQYKYEGQLLNRYDVGIHPYDVIFK